jgi:hypothetical protein
MKPLPLILLNALITLGVVFAYDQLRGAPQQAPADNELAGSASAVPGIADLEQRIAALESARRPMLASTGPADLLKRLEALEAQKDQEPQQPGTPHAAPAKVPTPRPGISITDEKEMSPEALAEFRRIIDQVKREERTKRIRKRTDGVLAKLELDLDEATRQKLAQAYGDFEQRRDEVWTEVKQEAADGARDADWAVIISETQARLAGEFRARIVAFVPDRGAGEVASALFPPSGSK